MYLIGMSSDPNDFVSCKCLIVNITVFGSTGWANADR